MGTSGCSTKVGNWGVSLQAKKLNFPLITDYILEKRVPLIAFGQLFFNWDSLHARLNSDYETWNYMKNVIKRLKHSGNLFRKNLQLKAVC